MDIFVMIVSLAGLLAFVLLFHRWTERKDAKESTRLKARIQELEIPPDAVFVEIDSASDQGASYLQHLKNAQIPNLAVPEACVSMASFRKELIALRKTRTRFVVLPAKNHLEWSAWLMHGTSFVAPVMKETRLIHGHQRLCSALYKGKPWLVERVQFVEQVKGSARAKVFLAPGPRLDNADPRSRLLRSDPSAWIKLETPEILWTGIDDLSNLIVRHKTRALDDMHNSGDPVIVVLNENRAKVERIPHAEWGSNRFISYKQLSDGEEIRQKCLGLYFAHRKEVFEQVKSVFIETFPELTDEIGFPLIVDKNLEIIVDELMSENMPANAKEKRIIKKLIENRVMGYICRQFDNCGNEGRKPRAFSQLAAEYLRSMKAETEEEAGWPEFNDMEILDYDEIMRDPLDDEPLNRF